MSDALSDELSDDDSGPFFVVAAWELVAVLECMVLRPVLGDIAEVAEGGFGFGETHVPIPACDLDEAVVGTIDGQQAPTPRKGHLPETAIFVTAEVDPCLFVSYCFICFVLFLIVLCVCIVILLFVYECFMCFVVLLFVSYCVITINNT